MSEPLTLQEIQEAAAKLAGRVVRTPVHRLRSAELDEALGIATELHLKLELLQLTGTFKARAALLNVLALSAGAHSRGVTAISAGNHAIAVAFAAAAAGVSAKVVMIATANPLRVALCRSYGAEIVFAPDAHAGFATVERIAAEEGRTFIHPFEGRTTALGTATLGLELCEQVAGLEAVIVPIGGGGLCAGVASAVKLLAPNCEVIGVEPFGADSMYRSFAAGEPRPIERVATIADSLGAPMRCPSRSNYVARTSTSWCESAMTSCERRCGSCSGTPSWQSNRQVRPRLPRCSVPCVSACGASALPPSSAAATSTKRRSRS